MKTSLRSWMGSLSLVLGCCMYATSNLVGHGWELRPDPVRGLLLASVGMMLCVLAIALMPDLDTRNDIVRLLKGAMVLGSFSLLATLGSSVLQPFHDLNNLRWGAIPPPGFIFGSLYGVVSIGAMLGMEIWEQKRSPVYQLGSDLRLELPTLDQG